MYTLHPITALLLALSTHTLADTTPTNNANLTLTAYQLANCNGTTPSTFFPLNYGQDAWGAMGQFNSYTLSRATTLQEQLDFSGPAENVGSLYGIPQVCMLFHETASPGSNEEGLEEGTCYELGLGAAQVSSFFLFLGGGLV